MSCNVHLDLDGKILLLKAEEKSTKELRFASFVAGICNDTELSEALMGLYCKKVDDAARLKESHGTPCL